MIKIMIPLSLAQFVLPLMYSCYKLVKQFIFFSSIVFHFFSVVGQYSTPALFSFCVNINIAVHCIVEGSNMSFCCVHVLNLYITPDSKMLKDLCKSGREGSLVRTLYKFNSRDNMVRTWENSRIRLSWKLWPFSSFISFLLEFWFDILVVTHYCSSAVSNSVCMFIIVYQAPSLLFGRLGVCTVCFNQLINAIV